MSLDFLWAISGACWLFCTVMASVPLFRSKRYSKKAEHHIAELERHTAVLRSPDVATNTLDDLMQHKMEFDLILAAAEANSEQWEMELQTSRKWYRRSMVFLVLLWTFLILGVLT